MKATSLVTKMALTGAMIAMFTGCASTSDYRADAGSPPLSTLSFSAVTDAEELVKWTGQFNNLASIQTYTLAAPAEMGVAQADEDGVPMFTENMAPGSVFVEAAGSEPKRVIRHAPHQR